jgi:hypothetical protein
MRDPQRDINGVEDDDLSRRLRAALEPTAEGARRVADIALAGAPRRGWPTRAALPGIAAVVAILIAVSAVRWRASTPVIVSADHAAARITSVGSLVIVENGEGGTWIRGSSPRDSSLQPGSRIAIVLKEVAP